MQIHITMPECAHCKAEIGLKDICVHFGDREATRQNQHENGEGKGSEKAEEMGDVVVFVWFLK